MNYIGIDMVEIARIQKVSARWGERFLHRIYTRPELEICRGRASDLAARFAAKEAVMKALGTGIQGVSWRDIEILSSPAGKPLVNLHGRAQSKANKLNLSQLAISLSHSREYAIACAAGLSDSARAPHNGAID
jgi:holo-[acyl-carrier protein] synthase